MLETVMAHLNPVQNSANAGDNFLVSMNLWRWMHKCPRAFGCVFVQLLCGMYFSRSWKDQLQPLLLFASRGK